ncbi:MAG: putative DNA modification/repair radical SAM protein [Phycisphaerae bacterium]
MDLREKLRVLADAAKYDASCSSSGSKRAGGGKGWGGVGNSDGTGICHSYTPDGRCVSLLKILLTNHCVYDCQYCVNRISSDVERARFTVGEVVTLTMEFYRRNYIEGLFLSSGIVQSVDYTMEQLVAVAKTLRLTHGFNGYVHLKTIPGASAALVAEAGRYADRLSANIELPTKVDLQRLAPQKKLEAISGAMGEIRSGILGDRDRFDLRARSGREVPGVVSGERFAPAGQSTQMIVGATSTADGAILQTADTLYRQYGMKRVYYSAFSPIPHGDSRLPVDQPPLVREHRLYQADWLMRYYGFKAEEIAGGAGENLALEMDPKLAWALRNRGFFPVDVNRAPRSALLRVPGLGVRNVDRILEIRRFHRVRLGDLMKMRVAMKRVRPFVVVADWHANSQLLDSPVLQTRLVGRKERRSEQGNLFESLLGARTGEF